MEKQGRNPGFDYLRAVACAAIVLLHTVYSTTRMCAGEMNVFLRVAGCQAAANDLMWAVPCFLMVTGALLLPPEKELSYKTLFSKYIARILKAILVFGLLFVGLELLFYPERRTAAYCLSGLYEIFTGDTWSHMWYLYCLIGLYLLLPVYKKITALSQQRDILYLLMVYGLFQSVLPMLGIWNIRCGFYIHVSSVYPFWLFLGYYLNRWGQSLHRGWYAAAFLTATAAITALSLVRTRWGLTALDPLFGYSSPLVILQAGGLAGCFFHGGAAGQRRWNRILSRIDRHSFGIYLIHVAYVRLLFKHLHFDPFRIGGIPGILLTSAIVFALAYATDLVMKKLPLFRTIV